MSEAFDVVVIGAGPPGENAAGRAADHGLSVAIVEERLAGGECSYYGCIPSKTLIRPGDVIAAARRVPGAAEAVTGTVDVAAAFAQRDSMTNNWTDDGDLTWFESKGIAFYRGRGRLDGHRAVAVSPADGSEDVRLSARRAVVVACGTVPFIPPVEGLKDCSYWTNRDITSVHELPDRLFVMGGGAIGAEMAQCFRRLGTREVTIIESADRLLAHEEPFAGEQVGDAFRAEGITVMTSARLVSVHRREHGGPVVGSTEDGREIEADQILVAVGRRPNTMDIGLDTVGLEPGKYLAVDERLRVAGAEDDGLYAVGDVNGMALLTHMGKYQGRLVGDAIAGKDVLDVADHGIVPRVTFTDPQVAAVGLTEARARESGRPVRVVTTGTGDVAGAYVRGNGIAGTSQLVVDEERRVLLGATFTGPDVQEMLHAATVAMAGEVTLDRLWHAVPAFPTMSEVWLRLLEAYGL
jgi:pyruvate/2-oxoglutarate dehydrogenase complex dihydrolipoamide dehydrogenase (E3) component